MIRIFMLALTFSLSSFAFAEPRERPIDWARPIIDSDLSNLYKVDDGVYRSEQPDESAFKQISNFGVKEVLNLRERHSDDEEAEDLNLKLHHIKIDTASITEKEITKALSIIQNRNGPILIHCWHGSDRTGAVIASYRVVIQNWPKQKAIDELISGGYGYHSKIYPNIVKSIKNLNVEKIRNKLGLAPQTSKL